jgi:hypothetical protein
MSDNINRTDNSPGYIHIWEWQSNLEDNRVIGIKIARAKKRIDTVVPIEVMTGLQTKKQQELQESL